MIKDMNSFFEEITAGIREHTDIAVLGLSGGVDSMVVAVLCKRALGAENVYAVHMPAVGIDTMTSGRFNSNSKKIGEKLGLQNLFTEVRETTESLTLSIERALGRKSIGKVNEGNARSRARMCVLYGIAHELNGTLNKRVRVVGTGNLSEDFIGYDTKGGDALADFFPIGELFKSEVYQLAEFFVGQGEIGKDMIDYTPSAGLWDGQSDEEELGYTYNEMEPYVRMIMNESGPFRRSPIGEFVYFRHLNNKHKHEAPPVIKLRDKKELLD